MVPKAATIQTSQEHARPVMTPKATMVHVGRYSSWSFVCIDLLFSVVWYCLILRYSPGMRAIKVGLTIGVIGVIADGGIWYGWVRTRKVERQSTKQAPFAEVPRWHPLYIGFWLLFWLDFVIGCNIGTWIGLMFERGLHVLNLWTAAFFLWFLSVAVLAKWITFGSEMRIRATRLMSYRTRAIFLLVPAVVYTVLKILEMLSFAQIGAMLIIGTMASLAMEFPLFALGWRHPKGHWPTPLANLVCEWNSVVPILYLVYLWVS